MGEERERRIGRYRVVEHTARRLVVEARGRPLVAIGVVWGTVILIVALSAPWLGGTRLSITLTTVLVAAVVTLLVLRFVPRRERVTVDLEAGEVRAGREFLLPPEVQGVQVPLAAVEGIRCRRQRWRDGPGVETERWLVELVGEGGEIWRLAEGEAEGPVCELAGLIAEVAGCGVIRAASEGS